MRRTLVLFAATMLFGCDGDSGGPSGGDEDEPSGSVVFHFKILGDASGLQDFRAATDDPEIIAAARQQLALPEHERGQHINGAIAPGDGGHNLEWSWHFVPGEWSLAEVSIELCDGTPTLVEQAIEYWVEQVGAFCPWLSHVADEPGTLSEATDQLIVRYVTAPSGQELELAIEKAQEVAAGLGIGLSYLRAGALGIHVFKLDGQYSIEDVEELAQALEAADAGIDYAEPDRIMQHQ